MLADALGRPLRFVITAGQTGDVTQAPALLHGQNGDAVLADKAYDSNAMRAIIADMGATADDPVQPNPQDHHPARHHGLQTAQSHRALLLSPQALPALGHTLRQTIFPLCRLHPPRSSNDLGAINISNRPWASTITHRHHPDTWPRCDAVPAHQCRLCRYDNFRQRLMERSQLQPV